MNAERLHVIAIALKKSLDTTKSQQTLDQLTSNLQNLASNPGHTPFQQQVSSLTDNLYQALANDPVESFSPSWKQIVKEIDAEQYFGSALKDRVSSIFARNQISPATAHQEVKSILATLQSFHQALDQLIVSFGQLKIGKEDLQAGQCEIGVLIPRLFVKNQLNDFASELKELDKILGGFSELATGSRPDFQIGTISSTEFMIYLVSAPGICAAVAMALDRLITKYEQLLRIKKLRNDLKAQGITDTELQGIDTHANTTMDTAIEELIPELLTKFYTSSDGGRRRELTIELKHSLKKLAGRIDRGYNIEIRAASEAEIDNADSKDSDAQNKLNAQLQIIKASEKKLQFIKADGPPILSLPNQHEDEKEKKR